jgi:preprotein translocase subunit YajC
MSLEAFLIPVAYADSAAPVAAQHANSPWGTVVMLVVFFAIFYFLLIRPQSKRAKAQRQLLASLGKGEEVVTAGGLMGRIVQIDDAIVAIEIAKDVVIRIQKGSISGALPKGTLKGLGD